MKRLFTYIVFTIASLSYGFTQGTAVETYGQLRVSGTKMVDQNDNPVQLQGMSLFWSQWGGEYYTAGVVGQMKDDWCNNVIRAAMGVEEGGYLTDPDIERARVETVVDAAIEEGIYVIIDWHDHDAHNHQTQAVAFFSYMAEKYGDYPNVIYEIYNEPLNVSWTNTIKPYCEAVIDAIREHDSDNIIICGTPKWSQDVDVASQNPITGESNIMYTLHFYAASHGAWLRNKAQTAINNGIALFVTEFGTVEASGDGDVNEGATDAWFTFLDQNSIGYCNWSLFDKDEGASALRTGTEPYYDLKTRLTASGEYMFDRFTSNCPVYNVDGPPVITNHPDDATVQEGESASFTVIAAGPDLQYQWKKDGENINGANDATFSINNVDEGDAGAYTVVVTNGEGSVTSDVSTLDVLLAGPYNGEPFAIPGLIEAELYDVGARNVTHYDNDTQNEGGLFRNDGVDIEATSDATGDYNVGWTAAGEWLEYSVDVTQEGLYDIQLRVASDNTSGGALSIDFNVEDVTGNVVLPGTGGWQTYQTVVVEDVALSYGEQKMRLNVETAGFNINFMNFILVESTGDDIDDDGVPASADCDDNDENVGAATTWYQDLDDDGFGDEENSQKSCDQPTGYVAVGGDECPNDENKSVPGNCGCGEEESACATGVNDLVDNHTMIYPNPFKDHLTIKSKGKFSVVVYNLTGSIVYSGEYKEEVNIGSTFNAGMYIVEVSGVDYHKTLKVVKL